MTIHLGELKDGGTHHFSFTTVDATGLPTVFTGSPALRIYKDANTTQTTTGITLAADFNALVGLNMVTLVLTDAFYVAATDYSVVIEAGTVGGVSVIGYSVAQFSIANRPLLGVATPPVNVVEINGETTITLPGQVAPPLAPTPVQLLGHIYKAYRNRKDQTATLWRLFADDESTIDQTAIVSDDGTTAIKQEIIAGT